MRPDEGRLPWQIRAEPAVRSRAGNQVATPGTDKQQFPKVGLVSNGNLVATQEGR